MAIKDIERDLDRFFEKTQRAVHTVNQVTGEKFVRNARQTNTYKDQTANLRNSIGYSAISPQQRTEIANSDAKEAISEAQGEVRDHGLIMVAGMNYARYVEAKGYDVITMSWEKAKVDHRSLMERMLKL